MAESKLYRIPFTGYCEVWGKTPEEAVEAAEVGDIFTAVYESFGEPVYIGRRNENELD